MPNHEFKHIPITIDDNLIDLLARKYIEFRAGKPFDLSHLADDPRLKNLNFSTDLITDIIQKNTTPIRFKKPIVRDIYRSDLGEMLMTLFFDHQENFLDPSETYVIPIKNIWDREHTDFPGRGLDLVGYKEADKKFSLLIGEAKVSAQLKNPPDVVDVNEDSIYNNQIGYVQDKKKLIRRLANYVKKLDAESRTKLSIILFALEGNLEDLCEIVYGCCLVRDSTCCKIDDDYGKMYTQKNEFEPNSVYFIVPSFNKSLEDTVDEFHKKVLEIIEE